MVWFYKSSICKNATDHFNLIELYYPNLVPTTFTLSDRKIYKRLYICKKKYHFKMKISPKYR